MVGKDTPEQATNFRVRFNFSVTPLARWSCSYRQSQLFLGVFQILKDRSQAISLVPHEPSSPVTNQIIQIPTSVWLYSVWHTLPQTTHSPKSIVSTPLLSMFQSLRGKLKSQTPFLALYTSHYHDCFQTSPSLPFAPYLLNNNATKALFKTPSLTQQ